MDANNSNYTALLRGQSNTTGTGLIEVYDLDQSSDSNLVNISGRGIVDAETPLISGFILGGNGTTVMVRAISPSLHESGVEGALTDPRVDVYDSNGAVVRANDDWRSDQEAAIENSGLAPEHDQDASLIATLPSGNYTAVVTGKDSGIALVEVYQLH